MALASSKIANNLTGPTQIIEALPANTRPTRALLSPLKWLNTLTFRGLTIGLLLYYCITQLTLPQNDILAAVLSASLGLVLLVVLVLTLAWGWYLRSNLSIVSIKARSYDKSSESSSVQAGVSTILTVSLSPFTLPPFYKLSAEITLNDNFSLSPSSFKTEAEISPLPQSRVSSTLAVFNFNFPHRGEWSVERVKFKLSDRFGLTQKSWFISESRRDNRNNMSLAVNPANPPRESANLPIIASRDREGDTLSQSNSRLGEPFDLKRYNPSDGLKKVIWKVFARSGELISRHPESAMTPEGECYIYVIAGPNPLGDQVARAALDYCKALEDAGVDLRLGCAGSINTDAAKSSSEALELMRESAWSSQSTKTSGGILSKFSSLGRLFSTQEVPQKMGSSSANTPTGRTAADQSGEPIHSNLVKSIASFLAAQPSGPPIHRLIIFLAPRDTNEEKQIIDALLGLSASNISPVIMLATDRSAPQLVNQEIESLAKPQSHLINKWFWDEPPKPSNIQPRKNYINLIQIAAQNGWEIYL